MEKQYCLFNESCMDTMKKIESDSIDLVLTQPITVQPSAYSYEE